MKIEKGIIYTKDRRYVKIIEIEPINFLLRSAREQKNIIYSFISYLKISPVKVQIKVMSKRADINRHLEHIRDDMARESKEKCIALQKDYENLIRQIGSKESITRRFFLIFEYESPTGSRRAGDESNAISELQSAVHTAKNYLPQCGSEVILHENDDEFMTDVLYSLLNRQTSVNTPLSARVAEVMKKYIERYGKDSVDNIPVTEFIAPESIDFSHIRYVVMNGVYHVAGLQTAGNSRLDFTFSKRGRRYRP